MKKTKSAFVFGALAVVSLAAMRCGGSTDSNSTPSTGAGGSSNTGGGGADGTGGAATGGASGTASTGGASGTASTGGAGGTANTGGASGTANTGGAAGTAGPTDGGGGTQMGAGGTQIAGDAGMCPGAAPMANAVCEGNATCEYPGAQSTRACTCRPTIGRTPDGGVRPRQWTCGNIPNPRDAGVVTPPDAGGITTCPNGTNDGDRCTMQLELCREGRNTTCVCVPAGNNLEWACN